MSQTDTNYIRVHNVEDLPNIVYQYDCRWWYDFDITNMSVEDRTSLLKLNKIYKQEETNDPK